MKISLITATYNSEKFLPDCLLSVSQQDYGSIEHIIVDGASTDKTVQLLRSCGKKDYVLITEPDDGIYQALNKGIRKSTGSIIGFLHADDVFASNDVLSEVAEIFSSDPSIDAVFGDLQYVKRNHSERVIRNWVSSSVGSSSLRFGWMPPHPTLYVKREWYEKIKGFDEQYKISADYQSVLKLFSKPDFKSVYHPKTFVKMRLGGVSNRSLKSVLIKSQEDWRALRSIGFNKFSALIAIMCKNFSKINQFF